MKDLLASQRMVHVCATAQSLRQFRLPLLKRLAARSARLVLYCPEAEPHSDLLRREGLEVVSGPLTNRPRPWTPYEVAVLHRYLRRERFDVLFGHQPMGALVGLTAAALARVPVRFYATGGLRFVPGRSGLGNRLIRFGEMRLVAAADAVLLVNREDEELLRGDPATRAKARWVGPRGGCGVDGSRFAPGRRRELRDPARRALGAADADFLIGYSGRMVWEKGLRELIAAAARLTRDPRLPRLRFVLIGEGRDLAAVGAAVARAGLAPWFSFPGYRLDIERWLSALDLFVLPSHREGMPVALIEAMALGLPVVATRVRGSRELLGDEDGGRLVPVGDAAALEAAIAAVAGRPDRGSGLGQRGAERIARDYDQAARIEHTLGVIEEVIRAKQDRRERRPS